MSTNGRPDKRRRTVPAAFRPLGISLLDVPDDVWKYVRECLQIPDVAVLASVNRQLNRLVTGATGFWDGFRQPELDLNRRHHRRLLALYRGEAARSGLRCVSGSDSTGCQLLRGIAVDELTVRNGDLIGLVGAPAAVRSLRLLGYGYKDGNVLPAALAALQRPRALLQLETSFFLNEAQTRAALAECRSLQGFSVLSSQCHFDPVSNRKARPAQFSTSPFQALEGLADLRRLEVRYEFQGDRDWLQELATLPAVEELRVDRIHDWHVQKLAGLAPLAAKLRTFELGFWSSIENQGLNCLANCRNLSYLDLRGDLVGETIDFQPLSTLPLLEHLGVSFRGDNSARFLQELLRCAPLRRVLRRLSIDNCETVTGADLARLPAGLQSLSLNLCAISDEGLAALPRGLKELSLGEETTDYLGTLSCAVEKLHLSGWDFSEDLPRQNWRHLQVLTELTFYQCQGLTDDLPVLPPNLQRLTFDSCAELDNGGLLSIVNALQEIQLRELTLQACPCREIPAAYLTELPSLQTLTLVGGRDFDKTVMNELFFRAMPRLYVYWK